MPASQREPDPHTDAATRLRDYLANHDALCPYCKYNLRGIRSNRCPECAANLDLELIRDGSEASRRPSHTGGEIEAPGAELSPWWFLLLAPLLLAALGIIIALVFGWIR
jgi:hypothetical protein